ncbi:MAG TPA: hypothetical protein PLY45_02090, partial [bacterium]|nr:hypothetical protein [bacterium]
MDVKIVVIVARRCIIRSMERIVAILTVKLGSRPLGIWVAWLGLLYAAMTFANKFFAMANPMEAGLFAMVEGAATWLVIIAAIAALARRRLIARMFGGMAMTLLFFHCLFW